MEIGMETGSVTNSNNDRADKADELAERKAALLRQGEYYRVGIVHAKATVKQDARPEAIFHRAIDHATWALRARVDGLLQPTGVNVSSLMPYAISIMGFLSRRRLVRPALGVVVAAGALAWYWQRRSRQVRVHH
jgi:hypothetical protein